MFTGSHMDETKAKIRASLKGRHHSDEARERMSVAGYKRTPETSETRAKKRAKAKLRGNNGNVNREAIRVGVLRHMGQCGGSCGGVSCSPEVRGGRNPSKLAWRAYDLFLRDFEVVIPEQQFGRYRVDFLLAEEWLAIEIDGEHWHNNRKHETRRDAYLFREYGLSVVRIAENEIV